MKRFVLNALQALGIVVYAVGIALAPLAASLSLAGWGYPWFVWSVGGLATLGFWVWLGDRFVLRRSQPRYGLRILTSVILLIAFIFGHPWIFGLPGRIGEIRLERSLKPGMTLAQSTEVIQKAGGDPLVESPTTLIVRFVDAATFCIEGGLEFTLTFDQHQTLKSWDSEEREDGC